MPIEHIFLDLDGVLADFFHPALARHGRADLATAWPRGVRDMAETMGLTWEAFWAPLVAEGPAFWADLPPLPWMEGLLAAVDPDPKRFLDAIGFAPGETLGYFLRLGLSSGLIWGPVLVLVVSTSPRRWQENVW